MAAPVPVGVDSARNVPYDAVLVTYAAASYQAV